MFKHVRYQILQVYDSLVRRQSHGSSKLSVSFQLPANVREDFRYLLRIGVRRATLGIGW